MAPFPSACNDAPVCKLIPPGTAPDKQKLSRGLLRLPGGAQKKELMLSQLRAELCISDERHDELRQCVSAGEERPWLRHALITAETLSQTRLHTHKLESVLPAHADHAALMNDTSFCI